MSASLEIRGLKVSYGGINAVRGVDLEVASGETVALIGANGAGKSTSLKAVCGLLDQVQGEIRYDGENIRGVRSHQLVERGLALVPEGRGVFARLTVHENLEMGAYCRGKDPAIAQGLDRVYAIFPRLHQRREQLAGTLSGGEQQMLVIGRAMMCRPRLMLLDEPSMGLAPMMVEKIFETIVAIAREGVTILLVEQNAKLALQICQRGYVMESGSIALSGSAENLLGDPSVRCAYLGEVTE
jgi:branched-chain amino acid transport system ATP-binding protein